LGKPLYSKSRLASGFINARFNQMEGTLIFISILDKAREFTYINRHLTVIFKPGGKLLGEIRK
jgi:hypothetical protein